MTVPHHEEMPVRAGYAAWAPWYDADGNPLTALEEPAMWGRFGPLEGRIALDLGCGTGRHTAALARAGATVAALDFTPEMMDIGRAKLRDLPVVWAQHRLPDPLPFRPDSFDIAVMGLVAEHIEALDSVLAEVLRVVRPGGACLVSALHPDRTAEGQRARFIDPETGVRRPIATIHRTLDQYREIAARAGWAADGEASLVVPPELAEALPRARPYVGRPLGWVGRWVKPG
ncbi:class I SAM-dependent methyltransferase [Tundrisphaera sp. TA3]|uniref:class I SAM-dependent methyltransferase n=1 Tax=Tundrisphaera sp. TA3 TaxID=3435775 RepID=UPI003EBCC090